MIAGQIEIQMLAEIVRLKKQMDEAQGLVERAARRMQAAADLARGALAGIAAGLTAGAFVAFVRGAIDAAEGLNDLSIKSGMTVERLSALAELGRTTGTSADIITAATNRLAKAMAGVDDETKGAGAALKSLGLDVKAFKDLKPDDQLLELARAMARFEDGSGKSAAAMALLGKSGADMLPFLKDLADANELVATTTTEQAKAADQFNDGLTLLGGKVVALQRSLAFSLLPSLNDMLDIASQLADIMANDVQQGVDGAASSVRGMGLPAQVLGTVLETLVVLGSDVSFVFTQMARDVAASAQAVLLMQKWDFDGARALIDGRKAAAAADRKALDDFQAQVVGVTARTAEASRVNAEAARLAQMYGAALDGAGASAVTASRGQVQFSAATDKAADEAAKLAKSYHDIAAASRGRVAAMQAEASGAGDLTEGERKLLELQTKIEAGTIEYSQALYRAAAAQLAAETAAEKRLRAERQLQQALVDAAKHQTKLAEAEEQDTERLRGLVAAELERLESLTLSEAALRERELSTLRATAADLEWQAANAGGNAVLEEQARLMRQRADLMERGDEAKRAKAYAEAMQQAAQQSRDAWQQSIDTIGDGLADALMRAFERGEDAADAFKQTLVNAFKTMVLEPQLRAAVNSGGNWLGQLMGVTSAAGGGSGGGALNNLSSLGTMYNTLSGWYAGGSTAAGASAAIAGSEYGAAVNAALAEYGIVSGGTSAAAGGSAAAASSSVSWIPIIGWIIAAVMASKGAYESGSTLSMLSDAKAEWGAGKFEADKYDTLTALGMSDKWAQILSGAPLAARLVGHKPSISGFGIGSIVDGDFVQGSSAPFQFGRNILGGGADPYLQDLVSAIAGNVALSAGMFGGGLTQGMRVGALTDNDREGQTSALLGYFGADNKLIAGIQTGSGAFGAGGPGVAASKMEGAKLQAWIAEHMPVLMLQGLQQSDLEDRFDAYFRSITLSGLSPEKAKAAAERALQVATAVQELTAAFGPVPGVFAQFKGLAVETFNAIAEQAGGFQALGQGINTYYQAFYTEAERTADTWGSITRTLNEAGVQAIPQTREQFRSLVNTLDLGTQSGQAMFVALMQVSGAFDRVAAASERVIEERLGLEQELLQLQGDTAELRRREREQLDPSNRALYDEIQALKDQQAAAEGAEKATQALADQLRDVRGTLLAGVGDAYQTVKSTVDAERQRVEAEAEAEIQRLEQRAAAIRQAFTGLMDSLADQVRALYGQLAGDAGRGSAMDTLQAALAEMRAGRSVDIDAVKLAAAAAAKVGTDGFSTRADYEIELARTAQLLRDVSGAAGQQMRTQISDVARKQVAVEAARDRELQVLDQQLAEAKTAAEALISIDDGVHSVAQAMAALADAIEAVNVANGGGGSTGRWLSSGDAQVWKAAGGAWASRGKGAGDADTVIRGLATTFSLAEARAFANDRIAAGDFVGLHARAVAEGIDSDAFDAIMGFSPGTAARKAAELGLAAFEGGTAYVPNTGIALVHEGERILTAAENSDMVSAYTRGAAGSADVCAELQEVRKVLQDVMRGMHKVASNTGTTAVLLEDVVHGGESLATRAES